MAFECRILADSVSPEGKRLVTYCVTFPRFILAEWNTHRALSRNAASSRAIPVEKRIAAVEKEPFVPESFGANRKGMQAETALDGILADNARIIWLVAKKKAVANARLLAEMGVHKQLANRLLEPFAWVTVVATATDWNNFFALRDHPDAQPEFQRIARMMREAREASVPESLGYGEWHTPFLSREEALSTCTSYGPREIPTHDDWCKLVSAGRCARVSYLTHEGKRDPEADIALAQRLIAGTLKHASPFEHQATPCPGRQRNFDGWRQFRQEIAGETVPG